MENVDNWGDATNRGLSETIGDDCGNRQMVREFLHPRVPADDDGDMHRGADTPGLRMSGG